MYEWSRLGLPLQTFSGEWIPWDGDKYLRKTSSYVIVSSITLLSGVVSFFCMGRTQGFVTFLEKLFPYRLLVARMTNLPIMRGILEKMLYEKTNLTYLPKDTVISIGKPVQPSDSIVLPSQVVEHFIRKTSYRFIMNFCICRDAMHCKDHPVELGCLFLGKAARDIPPGFGREATVDEALAHVERCRQSGLIHLIGRDKIDETWLGVGPGEKLLTICNCCRCCCLWNMLSDLDPQIRAKVKRMPGVEVRVTEKCTGCGTCIETCFMQAIQIQENRAVIGAECRGCGRCADRCPNNAIEVTITDPDFLQHTVDRIESSVDVT
jgi:NAD-dependent dihydropyrimidine dehydrogenase PreA subunit